MGVLDWLREDPSPAEAARLAGAWLQDLGANYSGRNSSRVANLQAQNRPLMPGPQHSPESLPGQVPTQRPDAFVRPNVVRQIGAALQDFGAYYAGRDSHRLADLQEDEMRRRLPAPVVPSGNGMPKLVSTPPPIPTTQLFAGVQPQLTSLPERRSFGDRVVDNALDVAGKVWTAPNTALGLAYGGLGTIAGLVAGTHPQIKLGHNAVQFLNNPFVDRTRAFTLGNSILYGRNIVPETTRAYGDPNVTIGPHEEAHTYQSEVLGPFYAPAYLLGGGFSGPEGNVFEKAAQNFGAGRGSWWP